MSVSASVNSLISKATEEKSFSATFGGEVLFFSSDERKITKATPLNIDLRKGTHEDVMNLLENMSSPGAATSPVSNVNLNNQVSVTISNGITGTFSLNNTFEVFANSRYPNQTIYVSPNDLYEINGKYYIQSKTEIKLPYACIRYPDGGTTNFIDLEMIVSEDTEVNLA